MILDLNGTWQFREKDGELMPASVPSTNYQDLLALGKIPDPFVKTNEKDVAWVAEKDWIYSRSFILPAETSACKKLRLCADRLDTVCEIKINGEKIADCKDCHIKYSIDITDKVHVGENDIEIYFYSPVNYVKEKVAAVKAPKNCNGMTGIVHVRKPQCHYGWDWGPVLPVSGVSGDIYIEGFSAAEITDLQVLQAHSHGTVTLTLKCNTEVFGGGAVSCEYAVSCPDGTILTATGLLKDSSFEAEVVIENPELWWTRELSDKSEQPLYGVLAAIVADGDIVAERTIKIGLRTIELDQSADKYGKNFCFKLNGVKIFAKGANFIPPDSLINRFSDTDYDKLLSSVQFSNMNMLRVWGGGYIGSDALYDKCDKLGILIWQDFPYACQAYPFFLDDFLALADREARSIIARLRHHASLAVWCGNNEIEQMTGLWLYMREYVAWTDQYFHVLLDWTVKQLDPERPYIAGTPGGIDFLMGVNADNVGDTHLWAVWHGLQPLTYYRKRMTRFCSEYGFESLPDLKTIRTYADESDFSLTSEVFNAHQKCGSGNKKMQFYIASRFRLPEKFTDYIYLSQVCQSECVRDAAEHWRRNKGRCNGALYWQLNDCWPVCSWSSVDYYGRYKALQYTSRRFFQPVTVSIEDSDGGFYVYTLNDRHKEINAKLSFKVCDYDGKVIISREKEVVLQPGECKNQMGAGMAAIRIQNRHLRAYAVATLSDDEGEIGRATVLLRKEKNAKLPVPTITKTMGFIEDGVLQITLVSDKYARFVRVDNEVSDAPFSDNYFDLLPGEPKIITQNLGKVCPMATLEKTITVFSAADLTVKGNAVTDFFVRAGVFLKPTNFFPFLSYRKIPRGVGKRVIRAYEESFLPDEKK